MPADAPPTAPISAWELIARPTVRVLFELPTYLSTQGVVLVTSALLNLLLALQLAAADPAAFDPLTPTWPFETGWATLGTIAGFALGVLGVGMGAVVSRGLDSGERLSLGAAWVRLAPRLANLFLTSLLLTGLAFLLLLPAVLGVGAMGASVRSGASVLFTTVSVYALAHLALYAYAASVWALALPVSVLESNGVVANLRRSARLTEGHRRKVFVAAYALGLGALASMALVALLVWSLELEGASGAVAYRLGTGIVEVLIGMGAVATCTYAYARLAERAEGPEPAK